MRSIIPILVTLFLLPLPLIGKDPLWMTVFVHGTVKGQWASHSLPRVMLDRHVANSTYEKAVRQIRNDPFFYQFHAMQEKGLIAVMQSHEQGKSGAPIIADLYEKMVTISGKSEKNIYYTFGWDGIVSQKMRMAEALNLYNALLKEREQIKQRHGVYPRIRLIGYSHGGNTCLNLARTKKKAQSPLIIDELILLGMPVQKETDFLVNDPLFSTIYHFYSPDDTTQRADFFSFKRLFSERIFRSRRGFTVPDKLIQVSISTVRYVERADKKNKNLINIPENYCPGQIQKQYRSPNHTELWYLGWGATNCRKTFPLFPIPTIGYIPCLIAAVEKEKERCTKFEISLHPQRALMEIKNKKTGEKKRVPFVSAQQLESIKSSLANYEQTEDFFEEKRRKSKEAISFARAYDYGGLVKKKRKHGSGYDLSRAPQCLN